MTFVEIKSKAARGGPTRRAAPPGGARKRGWGCHLIFPAITVLWASVLPAALPAASSDPAWVEVPSGLQVTLQEYRDETETPLAIFRARFVAPGLEQAAEDMEQVFADMKHLCNAVALPELATRGLPAQRIVVSLSSEPLDFGTIAPDVAQFFESYTIEDALCIWELF